jgi:CheY-like chemotaxis protein
VSQQPSALAIQLMDASSELVAVKDLAGVFVAANRAFRHAAALAEDRVTALTNSDLFDAEAARTLTVSEQLAVLAGQPVACDVKVAWTGKVRTLHAVCTPWREADRWQGVLLTGTLAARSDEAGRRLETLATSVGELAHKFNNALTTVVGLTDWHLVAGEPEPALRNDLEKIRDAATTAERTAREIQRLTRSAAEGLVSAPPSAAVVDADMAADAAPSAGVPRVLVVDDQADVRSSLSVMLRTLGCEVRAVESGAAAIDLLQREPPSLVISDLAMPGMDGLELASRLDAMGSRVPVVLLSGWTGSQGLEPPPRGVARTVGKPIRMAQLREVLSSLMPPRG